MADLRLGHFAVRVGTRAPIESEMGLTGDTLELLLASDLREVPVASEPPPMMARAALAESLSRSGIEPSAIATVIWTSTSFQERAWYTDDVSLVMSDLGLSHADAIGVTLGECGNFGSALRVARGLIAGPALLVCTDAVRPGASRLVPPSATVLGDGAASCVLGDSGRFSLLSVAQVSNHRVRGIDPAAQSVRLLRATGQGVAQAAAQALASAGVTPEDVHHLLLTNQNKAVCAVFAERCGIAMERVRTPTIAVNAHLFSGDLIAGLERLEDETQPGELVLAIANGTCTWSAMLLRSEVPT